MSEKSSIGFLVRPALIGLAVAAFSACSGGPRELVRYGWTLRVDPAAETLAVHHADLGPVLEEGRFIGLPGEKESVLGGWKVNVDGDVLVIRTSRPELQEWRLAPSDGGLDIQGPESGGGLRAVTPAGEDRIPARTADQDNGIMYTSLGRVEAANIHCLFDRPTGHMIHFPKKSRMIRAEDRDRMQVDLPAGEGPEIELERDYYIETLGLKYYRPRPTRHRRAAVAWSSWYCYYMGTTEADMIRETDALARHLLPYGLEYVQLDACYTRGESANYLEWNAEAFPRGGKWIFDYIRGRGLKPALWVNIYGSNHARPECADTYPENFYLRDAEGRLSGACCTADKTVVRLDYSNPAVIEQHLKPMFRTLKQDWGLTYLKDAGWGTWMDYYEKNRERAFDPSRGSRELYLAAQKALRETVGDDVYIGGCAMHEVGLGFGIFDGSRIGGDDKAVWYPEKERGMSMQVYFNSLFGGNYLNNIVWHCDPDAAMVRNPLTYEEGQTIVSAMGLTGQLYMASDFMDRLPPRKLSLYQRTIPTTPIVPIDLYPFRMEPNSREVPDQPGEEVVWCCPRVREFPRALDCKVNAAAGRYDVVAVFNWADEPRTCRVSLGSDLGLETGLDYVVFDFWDQKYAGTTRDSVGGEIPAHGTKVYVIKAKAQNPQVLATSRHITGTVSLQTVTWDEAGATLGGTSIPVPGDDYSLFIHVPEGFSVTSAESDIEVLFHRMDGPVCELKLSGQTPREAGSPVAWTIVFEK